MNKSFNRKRRQLLKMLGGIAGLSALSPRLFAKQESAEYLTKSIPVSGEQLPVIGLGTSRVFNVDEGAAELNKLREVTRLLATVQNSMVDSSPMYGEAERVVGDLVEDLGVRKQLFFSTKVWTTGKQAGIEQMQQSMQLMQTTTIDLMQIHNLVDWKTHIKTLRDWKEQGIIRYLGITHYNESAHEAVSQVMQQTPLDFLQINYSLAEPEVENNVLSLAQEKGIAVIANRPFARGALFHATRGQSLPAWAEEIDCNTWAQFFLKFVVSHPAVTCAIPGTSKVKHMLDNQAAGRGRMPDDTMRIKMQEFIRNS